MSIFAPACAEVGDAQSGEESCAVGSRLERAPIEVQDADAARAVDDRGSEACRRRGPACRAPRFGRGPSRRNQAPPEATVSVPAVEAPSPSHTAAGTSGYAAESVLAPLLAIAAVSPVCGTLPRPNFRPR